MDLLKSDVTKLAVNVGPASRLIACLFIARYQNLCLLLSVIDTNKMNYIYIMTYIMIMSRVW